MLLACWSTKGGVGVSVTAALIALAVSARADGPGALLVDLCGDAPVLFGHLVEPDHGLGEWLRAGPEVPPDALARLELVVGPRLRILPAGTPAEGSGRVDVLRAVLASDQRIVVIDAGCSVGDPLREQLVAAADRSVLIVRACPLFARSLTRLGSRPDGVIIVRPPAGAPSPREIETWCDAPVLAQVDLDPAVSRAVAAGLQRRRVPRSLLHALGTVA